MANVTVECRNFSGRYLHLNGTRTRNITRLNFVWAIMTVGAQDFNDLRSLGLPHLLSRFGSSLSALPYLKQRGSGLCISSDYTKVDMSDKTGITYWFGMAMAKLTAASELGIRWLAHVDAMKASGALTISSGSNKRGDLVGKCNNGDWHVIEAKGRFRDYLGDLIKKAKDQANCVTSISGQPPATTSACITRLGSRSISVLLDDPSSSSEIEWRVNEEEFFRNYYKNIIESMRRSSNLQERKIGNTIFLTINLNEFCSRLFETPTLEPLQNARLGLMVNIFDAPGQAQNAVRDLPYDDRIGPDGVAIFGRLRDWPIA